MRYNIITQGHGGVMSVRSDVGHGTAFTVMVPLALSSREKTDVV